MKKEREIIINVIENSRMNYNRLSEFFARKYSEKYTNESTNKKS